MTAPPPAAPRNFTRAAALYLAHETDFPTRWRRDSTLQTWRYRDAETGHWPRLLGDLAPLAHQVTEHLESALADEVPPFVFRCVGAPVRDTKVRAQGVRVDEVSPRFVSLETATDLHVDWVDPVLTVDDLAAATSWDAARERLVDKHLARFRRLHEGRKFDDYDRAQRAPLVTPEQRDTLLKAASAVDTPTKVLTALSGLPECLYARPAAPVEVDARAWVAAHLVAAPGADVGMRWARAAYVEAAAKAAPGVAPLDDKRFRALVEEAGIEVRHRKNGKRAVDVALVGDHGRPVVNPDEAPALRLVAAETA